MQSAKHGKFEAQRRGDGINDSEFDRRMKRIEKLSEKPQKLKGPSKKA